MQTYAPGEPVPMILDPKNRAFLPQIVNLLDPFSFLNLASTCKTLHDYCFSTKEIRITYVLTMNVISSKTRSLKFFLNGHDINTVDYAGFKHGFLSSVTCRKKLRNCPFVFKLKKMDVKIDDDGAFFTRIRSLFAEFPIQMVNYVSVKMNADWNELIQFLKDFDTKSVSISGYDVRRFPLQLDDATIGYFLQNFENFRIDKYVSDELILNASVPKLRILNAYISSTAFVDLIMKFVDSTDEIDWWLGCQDFKLREDALRSFNLLPFDFEGVLPNENPIIFVKDGKPKGFWLLRKDGKVMHCYKSHDITFTMWSPFDYPRCVYRDFH